MDRADADEPRQDEPACSQCGGQLDGAGYCRECGHDELEAWDQLAPVYRMPVEVTAELHELARQMLAR